MSKKTILIVEDDAILAMDLQGMITRMNYNVAGPLSSGEEAITFLLENKVDLVLMDIELAGDMNGITTAQVLNRTSDVPIVFLTGFSQDPLLDQAKIAAPYGYLIKPVPERELAAALQVALHRHMLDRKLKKSVLELHESEHNYKILAESGQAMIWTSGTDKLCNYFNTIWYQFTGRTSVQEIGNGWLKGVHPDDLHHCLDTYSGAFDRLEKFSMEYRLRRYDGEYRWIVDEGCPRYNYQGQFIGYIGHCLDITARKLAEEEVRRNELRLRSLVDILQRPFHSITDLLNCALDEAIQLTGSKIGYIYHYHEERRELVLNAWSKEVLPACTVVKPQTCYELAKTGLWGEAVRQRQPIMVNDFQKFHPQKKGYPEGHVQLLKFVTIPIFKGKDIVSVVGLANKETDYEQTDILQISLLMEAVWKVADGLRAEEENTKLEAQLQQAQKMEAIGTLAGGIAHDFNNILGAILGYAEMAREGCPAGSTVANDIEQVVKAGHRAKELVQQILSFSRQEKTQDIMLNPATIIREAIKMLRSSLPTTIDIQQDIDPGSGVIMADPTQFHQILMNLCTNAYHAMEETGGTLSIALRKKFLDQNDLAGELHAQPGQFVQLSISDTGSGIDPAIHKRIFEPYFTTKDRDKGTGMGLAIIHGIVKNYGGIISCSSRLGEGTEFHVLLPVIADEIQSEEKPITSSLQSGNERILLVDDEELLVDLNKSMLDRLGYQVTARTSSLEALTTFQNRPNNFDLVITDQTMPNMTGSDLARKILHIRPDMPIILCTGFSSRISAEKAEAIGIKGFAMKPFLKKDIAALIRKLLDESL